MRRTTVGIVGQGFVGSAVYAGFKDYFQTETFDIAKDSTCDSLKELIEKCQFIFLCLPTPMDEDGSCYTGMVEDVIKDINRMTTKKKVLIVKSTIPPGTTDGWNKKYDQVDIVFNPEFLTEANAMDDFKNQTRIVLGGDRKANARVKNSGLNTISTLSYCLFQPSVVPGGIVDFTINIFFFVVILLISLITSFTISV